VIKDLICTISKTFFTEYQMQKSQLAKVKENKEGRIACRKFIENATLVGH